MPVAAGAGSPGLVAGGVALGALAGAGVGITPPVKAWVERRSATHRLAERAGAKGTVLDKDLTSLGVHRSDRDVTQFAPRDLEPAVRNALADGLPVLVKGPSSPPAPTGLRKLWPVQRSRTRVRW
jgi:hypothetical protein